ncbi:hypothetical protein RCL1_001841 [Eukaryota sp. TZLM3-RCL]
MDVLSRISGLFPLYNEHTNLQTIRHNSASSSILNEPSSDSPFFNLVVLLTNLPSSILLDTTTISPLVECISCPTLSDAVRNHLLYVNEISSSSLFSLYISFIYSYFYFLRNKELSPVFEFDSSNIALIVKVLETSLSSFSLSLSNLHSDKWISFQIEFWKFLFNNYIYSFDLNDKMFVLDNLIHTLITKRSLKPSPVFIFLSNFLIQLSNSSLWFNIFCLLGIEYISIICDCQGYFRHQMRLTLEVVFNVIIHGLYKQPNTPLLDTLKPFFSTFVENFPQLFVSFQDQNSILYFVLHTLPISNTFHSKTFLRNLSVNLTLEKFLSNSHLYSRLLFLLCSTESHLSVLSNDELFKLLKIISACPVEYPCLTFTKELISKCLS